MSSNDDAPPFPGPEGVAEWNDWRALHSGESLAVPKHHLPGSILDAIDLSGLDLANASFREVSLVGAIFDGADLQNTSFWRCDLEKASFLGATLTGAKFSNTSLEQARFLDCDFRNGVIVFCRLADSQLNRVELTEARLTQSDFSRSSIAQVGIHGAEMLGTGFINALLLDSAMSNAAAHGANFDEAQLQRVTIEQTNLAEASFHNSEFIDCVVRDCDVMAADFSGAKLRGCTVQNVDMSRTLSVEGMQIVEPREWYATGEAPKQEEFRSVFLSYSRDDADFAHDLHRELLTRGVPVWLDVKEMYTTDWIETSLKKAIGSHELVVLILSRHSSTRDWVRYEVELANRAKVPVVPIRLSWELADRRWVSELCQDHRLLDFSSWSQSGDSEIALNLLLDQIRK